jgi:hypothetical protein
MPAVRRIALARPAVDPREGPAYHDSCTKDLCTKQMIDDGGHVDKPRGTDSFSWLYRTGFRTSYILLHVMGPATLDAAIDPRARRKREYLRRRELHRQWRESARAAQREEELTT